MTHAVYFKDQNHFRSWLVENHLQEKELLAGFYKKASGQLNMTWPESVDQALCFGWIDGVRRTVDENRYTIRFTPRRKGSNWSTVNIKKIGQLIKEGLVHPAGIEAFERRTREKPAVYSFENRERELLPKMAEKFKSDEKAWTFFSALAPSYRRTAIFYVMSAKGENTRQRRLEKLIEESSAGRRLR